ncbi:hypothetical protein EDD86DRAFT_208583 [Gorgonomyces haynaldii]|nr:hypothetical protein EDD86DRAFT_208583 [Gorgonomyces haynaldii]
MNGSLVLENALGGTSTPSEIARRKRLEEERRRDMRVYLERQAHENPRLAKIMAKKKEPVVSITSPIYVAPQESHSVEPTYSPPKPRLELPPISQAPPTAAPPSQLFYNPVHEMPQYPRPQEFGMPSYPYYNYYYPQNYGNYLPPPPPVNPYMFQAPQPVASSPRYQQHPYQREQFQREQPQRDPIHRATPEPSKNVHAAEKAIYHHRSMDQDQDEYRKQMQKRMQYKQELERQIEEKKMQKQQERIRMNSKEQPSRQEQVQNERQMAPLSNMHTSRRMFPQSAMESKIFGSATARVDPVARMPEQREPLPSIGLRNLSQDSYPPWGMAETSPLPMQQHAALPPINQAVSPTSKAAYLRGEKGYQELTDWDQREIERKKKEKIDIQEALRQQIAEKEALKRKQNEMSREEEKRDHERLEKERLLLQERYAKELEENRVKEEQTRLENERNAKAKLLAMENQTQAKAKEELPLKEHIVEQPPEMQNTFRSSSPPIPTIQKRMIQEQQDAPLPTQDDEPEQEIVAPAPVERHQVQKTVVERQPVHRQEIPEQVEDNNMILQQLSEIQEQLNSEVKSLEYDLSGGMATMAQEAQQRIPPPIERRMPLRRHKPRPPSTKPVLQATMKALEPLDEPLETRIEREPDDGFDLDYIERLNNERLQRLNIQQQPSQDSDKDKLLKFIHGIHSIPTSPSQYQPVLNDFY